jgi:hypothetical protein
MFQFFQRVAPHIVKADRSRNRSVCGFGEFNVFAGVTNAGFVENGLNGMWKDLIDTPSGHDVATHE